MTAVLTDHYGAIDPAAFDADHPVRPHAPKSATKDLASNRLWGNVTHRSSSRRIVAVGWAWSGYHRGIDDGVQALDFSE